MLARPKLVAGLLLVLGLTACSSTPEAPQPAPGGPSTPQEQPAPQAADEEAAEEPSHGFGHRLLWYIPNRISDVLDVVRARVRVGHGFAVGVRATELADVYLGSYGSIFVGIPGPRGERSFNWPFGFETKSGMEISVVDASLEGEVGPNYGLAEFGVSFQLLIVGVDVGVDPLEVVDLAVGLLTFDIMDDDL
jgi:hypothetical protein